MHLELLLPGHRAKSGEESLNYESKVVTTAGRATRRNPSLRATTSEFHALISRPSTDSTKTLSDGDARTMTSRSGCARPEGGLHLHYPTRMVSIYGILPILRARPNGQMAKMFVDWTIWIVLSDARLDSSRSRPMHRNKRTRQVSGARRSVKQPIRSSAKSKMRIAFFATTPACFGAVANTIVPRRPCVDRAATKLPLPCTNLRQFHCPTVQGAKICARWTITLHK